MPATGQVIAAATAFVWLGMVLAISFLETPLKLTARRYVVRIAEYGS